MIAPAPPSPQFSCDRSRPTGYLEGRFSGDVGDQEVHSNVLAVEVMVHQISGFAIQPLTVQKHVILQQENTKSSLVGTPILLSLTLCRKAAPVSTIDSSHV